MSTILVVDDEVTITEIVEQLLTVQGYQVICTANGKETLKIIERQAIDLVITDIIMPEMDGYELIMKLRKQTGSPKVIAMSGGSSGLDGAGLLQNALLMKADKILPKPFTFKDLNDAVIEVLEAVPSC
jgi:two-component system, OmpR family, response regulator SaeR